MTSFNIHAGHNWNAVGANGCFSETKEDRIVKDKVIALLKKEGHTVYDCTDEVGATVNQNLVNIVNKCNKHKVALDVSIHFNAFNGSAHGVEVFTYDNGTNAYAQRICNNISALGFTNRGVKNGSGLYVLWNTISPAILIECCFCDNRGDANLYNSDSMAKAIVEGILNKKINGGTVTTPTPQPSKPTTKQLYRVRKSWADSKSQIGAYQNLESAKKLCDANKGYYVFDWNGKAVYPVSASEPIKKLYYVRKSWDDKKSQLGAYSVLDNAKRNCPNGYYVFDWEGNVVYTPVTPSPEVKPEVPVEPPKEEKPIEKPETKPEIEEDNSGNGVVDEEGNDVIIDGDNVVTLPNDTEQKPVDPEPEKPVEKPTEPKPEKPVVKPDISPLKGLGQQEFIEYIGAIAKEDMKKSGVLASVTIAQAILESAYGQSELSLKANNLFGMKEKLSGNNWYSEWKGGTYTKYSPEEYETGIITQVHSVFRAYDTPEESIVDHRNYLIGAKNGTKLRYEGLVGEKDYRKAIQIIKDGGYATDSKYVDKVCEIIERYKLDSWDYAASPSELEGIRDTIDKIAGMLVEIVDTLRNLSQMIGRLIGGNK